MTKMRKDGMPVGKPFTKSGNLKGRPIKDPLARLLKSVNPFAAAIIAHSAKTLTRRLPDGSTQEVTRLEAMLERMFKAGMENSASDRRFLTELSREALAQEASLKAEVLLFATNYKERYTSQYETADRMGRTMSRDRPDPRDIEICENGEVIVHGPVTSEDYRKLDFILETRDITIGAIASFEALNTITAKQREANVKSLKRKRNMLNSLVPPRLRSNTIRPSGSSAMPKTVTALPT